MVTDLLWVLAGLLLLLAGAELLVRGASALALRLGITPVVVGLTVVAFGTSSPELVVSVTAALHGQPGVALGNVVGSNICNLALILGLTALIRPVAVHTRVILLDMPLMIGVSLVTWGLLADGRLGRFDGLLLTIGVVVFTGFSVRQGRREASSIQQDFGESVGGAATRLPPSILAVVGGLVVLTFGGRLLVDGAIGIARGAGVSEAVIGLTLVAVGTSLPELATSAVAALRG
ncbi:MAG: calcium/sodium antiporter, partial [Acidobacteria bacterium]|nr:calcium/sodium antiporter [Acidobacteriota bacterium]